MSGLWLALVLSTASPAPLRVALPGFTFVNLDPRLGEVFLDRFVNVLGEQGVVATSEKDVAQVLGVERQKALLGCGDSSGCSVELAGALGVDAIIVGSLARVGAGYTVNLRVLRASSGTVLATATERVASESALQDWFDAEARALPPKLRAALGLEPLAVERTTSTPAVEVSPVVRWVPAMVGGAALVAGGISLWRSYDAAAKLRSGTLTLKGQADAIAAGSLEQDLAIVGFGVGGALIATSIVWAIISHGPPPAISVAPTRGGVTVGWSLAMP